MKRKILSWVLVVLWMALIFYLSHQPAIESNRLSTGITEKIVVMVEKVAPDIKFNMGRFNHIIRKSAHFFAYLVLGILMINGLSSSDIYGFKGIGLAILICILYAISDEVHQLFVPGRGGQVSDVILDSVGTIVGILGYKGFSNIGKYMTEKLNN